MSRNKVFSTILLSILLVATVSATPGVEDWGRSTTNIEYDPDAYVDVHVNTSGMAPGDYFVLYPIYRENDIVWEKLKTGGGTPVKITVDDDETEKINDIIVNVSGLWALSASGTYDGTTPIDFFWVNGTNVFDIEVSLEETTFGDNESISITVTKDNNVTECWIDVFREDGVEILHRYRSDGIIDDSDWSPEDLEWAGNYTVQAYRDVDDQYVHPYDSYFNEWYDGGKVYNFSNVGAFDPPEHTATQKLIVVNTGTPETEMDVSEVFWSFDDEINITTEVEDLSVVIFNDDDENVTEYLDISYIDESILIKNKDPSNISAGGWGRDALGNVYGNNGTWTIFLFNDIDSDGIEEWNATLEFKVLSSDPVQWFWIDDDGVTSNDNRDSEIPRLPDITEMPLNVQFQIVGDDHTFYGALSSSPVEDYGENITVSGDALFLSSKTLDEFPGVTYLNGTWTVPITPIMTSDGSMITFEVDWDDYGSLSQELKVGGTEYNGTIVYITPETFTIDEDTTISVDVFGPPGDYPIPYADVAIYWLLDDGTLGDMLNETDRPDEMGSNTYSFLVDQEEQNENLVQLPRRLIAYADVENLGSGYAMSTMKPKSDLTVTISQDVLMAGERSEFTLSVRRGNDSEPQTNGMILEFYDEDGDRVALSDSFGTIRNGDVSDKITMDLEEAFIKPGIYTIYAHNQTHDSSGNNATLEIRPVTVSASIDEFIWKFDKNINVSFYVQYNGEYINGTLEIWNISDEGNNHRLWVDGASIQVDVRLGIATVDNINVSELPPDSFQENVSFIFRPDTSGSRYAPTDGYIPVQVAHVTANPSLLSFNEPTILDIQVTGRNMGLDDVLVGIHVPGHEDIIETQTDSNGLATFAFTTITTGDVTIEVEERLSDVTVLVTAWSLYLSAPSQVNEGETFSVTIRNGTANGDVVSGVLVTFSGTSTTGTTLTAPTVRTDMYYKVTVTKQGYKSATTDVLVLNHPKLSVYTDSTTVEYKLTGKNTFTVTIADDEGKPIVGAVVIFNGVEYTTGANGMTTLCVPEEEGSYTIEAVKDGFASSELLSITTTVEKSTPGFELLALIVAIGVCIALVRMRKKK